MHRLQYILEVDGTHTFGWTHYKSVIPYAEVPDYFQHCAMFKIPPRLHPRCKGPATHPLFTDIAPSKVQGFLRSHISETRTRSNPRSRTHWLPTVLLKLERGK